MFRLKYHHNLVYNRHFRSGGRANDDDDENDINIPNETIEAPNTTRNLVVCNQSLCN
jgi:hypothetical protein